MRLDGVEGSDNAMAYISYQMFTIVRDALVFEILNTPVSVKKGTALCTAPSLSLRPCLPDGHV